MTAPDSFPASTPHSCVTFTAPSNATLDADTTYAVVALISSGTLSLTRTTRDGEDSGSQAGWSIADEYHILSGSTWDTTSTNRTLSIAVRGTVDSSSTSDDATLSALVLEDDDDNTVTLDPTFDSATISYTAGVENDVEQVTVTPTTNNSNATVEYLDENDAAIDDADSVEDGHQVALDVGGNTVRAKVTAEDTTTTQTYTIVVRRFGDEVWSGTLNVKDLGSSHGGCANSVSGSACSDSNILSEDEFTHYGTDYSITAVRLQSGGQFQFWTERAAPTTPG